MVKKLKLWMMTAIVCGVTVLTACTSNEDNGGTTDDGKARKALLVILDGWGIGDKGQDDAIAQTATPYMDYLKANYPNAELQASGGYVGLPDGKETETMDEGRHPDTLRRNGADGMHVERGQRRDDG